MVQIDENPDNPDCAKKLSFSFYSILYEGTPKICGHQECQDRYRYNTTEARMRFINETAEKSAVMSGRAAQVFIHKVAKAQALSYADKKSIVLEIVELRKIIIHAADHEAKLKRRDARIAAWQTSIIQEAVS